MKTLPVSLPAAGLGILTAVPSGSTAGTVVTGRPDLSVGLLLCLKLGDIVSFYYTRDTDAAPTGTPSAFHTVTGEREVSLFFTNSLALRVIAASGTPTYCWM